jgi:hypothetical protein
MKQPTCHRRYLDVIGQRLVMKITQRGAEGGGYRADAIIKMDCKQVSFLHKQKEKKNRWPQTSSEIKAPFFFRFANISLGVGFYLYLLTKEKSGKYSININRKFGRNSLGNRQQKGRETVF